MLPSAAALVAAISLKTLQVTLPEPGMTSVAAFLAPFVGLAASAGLAVAAWKLQEKIQADFFFKDYIQSRSGH